MCGRLYFLGTGILSSTGAIHGCYMKGCYVLRCELCTIATVLLGHQQALAVRWLVAFPICSLLLSKKGLWPSLWPVWHLFFASIQKNETWDRKKWKEKKEKSFWKYLPCPKILHNADTICLMQTLVLPPCVLLELWLSRSAGWHWLALRGWWWGSPWFEKEGRKKEGRSSRSMQDSMLSVAKAPSWVGLWEDLAVTLKE